MLYCCTYVIVAEMVMEHIPEIAQLCCRVDRIVQILMSLQERHRLHILR
jgi:hypothetical protein